jgi:glycerol-3-phosphate dehydrogenase
VDVLYTFSGVRPLPFAPGVVEAKIPRSHVLHDHAPQLPGLVTVVGGKLTTFRQLAQDAVDDAFRRLGRNSPVCMTAKLPFPGATSDKESIYQQLMGRGLSARSAERLLALYGRRALDVVAEAENNGELLDVVHAPSGAIAAELVFAMTHEFAATLADVLARRLLLAFESGHALQEAGAMADIIGARFGWDVERRAAEINGYKAWLSHLAVPEQSQDQAR